jgi:hypothetical protein
MSMASGKGSLWYIVPADDKEDARNCRRHVLRPQNERPKMTDERHYELMEIREQLVKQNPGSGRRSTRR